MSAPAREWLQRRYRPYMARLYRPPLGPPLSLLYRGDRVTCPCCGRTARKFIPTVLPVGPNRANARCPNCGARDRQRYMWLYLERKTNILVDHLRVLHFAPERIFEEWLRPRANLDYVSTDLSRARADVKADITDLPFPDDSFDVILCSHVLEHVVEDREAMRELHRVLRPGGWALVLVPIDFSREETFEDPTIVAPADRERLFGQADHVRIYGRDFTRRLEEAGFTVRVEDFRGELGEAEARKYGLRPRKPDFHLCTKNNAAGTPTASRRRVARGAQSIRSALVENVDTNRKLWDKYARGWNRETIWLDSGTGEPTVPSEEEESYREAHINVLGDEWARPEEVDQVVAEYIYPYIDADSTVGEIGVGGGRIASRVAGRVRRFVAFDVSSEMLAKARAALANQSNVEYVLLDEPVFEERLHEAFDFVYSFDVFVHLDLHVMWKYFLGIGAILRPGGRTFVHTANLTAPAGWARFERQSAYSVPGHYFVSPDIVLTLAERRGFKIVKTSTPDPGNVYLNRDYLVVMEK